MQLVNKKRKVYKNGERTSVHVNVYMKTMQLHNSFPFKFDYQSFFALRSWHHMNNNFNRTTKSLYYYFLLVLICEIPVCSSVKLLKIKLVSQRA